MLVKYLRRAFQNGPIELGALYKQLNDDSVKANVWVKAKTNVDSGNVHALILQLVLTEILSLDKEGKANLAMCAFSSNDEDYKYEKTDSWNGMNVV